MEYKFYVKKDGKTSGPYSATEVRDLQLKDDVLVREKSKNEWLPVGQFDLEDMVKKELRAYISKYHSIKRSQQSKSNHTSSYSGDVSDEIKGWNWGAFWFHWLWGLFNGIYWPLILIPLTLLPGLFTKYLLNQGDEVLFYCVCAIVQSIFLAFCIILGIKGNEWAWKAKSWSSVAEFKRVQRNWAIAILWELGILFGLGVLIGIAASILY